MANTPDKTGSNKPAPKPLDIMSRDVWSMEPGYRKARPDAAAADTVKVAAETRAPAHIQTQPPTQQTREQESPATQEAAAAQPEQSQSEGPRAAAPGEPAAAPAKLTPTFAVATSLPFHILAQAAYAAPNRESPDPHAEREAHLIADAKDNATISNGATAMRIAATSATAAGKGHQFASERDEDSEEKERKRKNDLFLLLDTFEWATLASEAHQMVFDIEQSLNKAIQEREALQAKLTGIRRETAAVEAEIKTREETVVRLKEEGRDIRFKMRPLYEDYHDLRAEYDLKLEADKQRLGVDENGVAMSDPMDETLRQQAWEKNRDKVEALYKSRGLEEEFKILEKSRNGESVDQKELEKAAEKIKSRNLPADLDQAMLRVDRNNEFFKTASGLRVRIRENVGLIDVATRMLDKNEKQLTRELEKLEECKAHRDKLKADGKLTEDQIKKYDDFIEAKKAQLKRAEDLEKKINDPEFRKAYDEGKISKEQMAAMKNEFTQLRKDIKSSDDDFNKFRKEVFGSRPDPAGAPAADKSASPPRTSTDSAAGLVSGSALAQADGLAKQPFNKAASGSTATDAAATPEAALAANAEQQKRQQFAAAGLNT